MEDMFSSRVVNGTAIKQKMNGVKEAPTYTIPYLCQQEDIELDDLALVKIDTDGYDSDCICSFGAALQSISPILYWENQIDNDAQLDKFLSMIDYLKKSGYDDFFVFDNFGNYLCHMDAMELKNINLYLARMLHGKSTRSFFYVDVLAAKSDKALLCSDAVKKYLKKYQ